MERISRYRQPRFTLNVALGLNWLSEEFGLPVPYYVSQRERREIILARENPKISFYMKILVHGPRNGVGG